MEQETCLISVEVLAEAVYVLSKTYQIERPLIQKQLLGVLGSHQRSKWQNRVFGKYIPISRIIPSIISGLKQEGGFLQFFQWEGSIQRL